LEPGEVFDAPCDEGCVIRVDGFDEELAADTGDAIMIKDGKLQPESES